MKYVIDRIEGSFAVCELPDKTMKNISIAELPLGIQEGSIISFDGTTWSLDNEETQNAAERIRRKMDALWK